MDKAKLAIYWASACGGCDISIVELGEHLLELAKLADIVFWPCAMDFKYDDIEKMEDGSIDVTLVNGSIRTTEDLHVARLLRAKSKALIAFGSCAIDGCVPGLSNIKGADYALMRAFKDTSGTSNAEGGLVNRMTRGAVNLDLPTLFTQLRSLGQVVVVDAYIPGCPPNHDQVWKAINYLLELGLPQTPERLLGVDERALCDQCPRIRKGKIRVERFYRIYEAIPDPEQCLLEQGFICAGPATHAGCGAACIKANMPCRGCYGPPDGVKDQGAAILAAVVAGLAGQTDEAIRTALASIVDPIGTFYRYSYATSTLGQLSKSDGSHPTRIARDEGDAR
ncbi:MAG: NADH-quinone oxidoreductase subunit B family protein [Anaerolineae bacterium]